MGKSKMVETVQEQALKLRESLAKEAGTPGVIPHQLYVTITNVIWQMVASEWRLDRKWVVRMLIGLKGS